MPVPLSSLLPNSARDPDGLSRSAELHACRALPDSMALTSIEQFHLLSGDTQYPNVLFCRLWVAKVFARDVMEQAVECVARRHCIWNRRLDDSDGKLAWRMLADQNTSMLTWSEEQACPSSGRPLQRPLSDTFNAPGTPGAIDGTTLPVVDSFQQATDPRKSSGVHVWCHVIAGRNAADQQAATDGDTRIIFACDHTVSDGIGGAHFINDLFIAYDNLESDRPWDQGLRQLEPARMRYRNRLGIGRCAYWKHLWKQPIALAGMVKFLLRGFHRIDSPCKASSANMFGLSGRWISKENSDLLDRCAARKGVAVNSIVMAAVFYALPKWSQQHTNSPVEKWFRLVLPISIRSKDDLRLPMTNRATIVQVDRCEAQMQDVDSFLHYLDREVKLIVGGQFDKLFLMMVRLMSVSRGWLRRSATNPQARGTIVFTNLGQPLRAMAKRGRKLSGAVAGSGTQLVEFDFGGPIRSAMPLNFMIQRHEKRYRISVRYDGRVLTALQATAFLDQVEKELESIIAADGANES